MTKHQSTPLSASILVKPTPIGSMLQSNVLTSRAHLHPQVELSCGILSTSSSPLVVSPSTHFTNVPKKVVKILPTTSVESSDEKWLDALEVEPSKVVDVNDEFHMVRSPALLVTQHKTLSDIHNLTSLLPNPSEELEILSSDGIKKHQSEERVLFEAEVRSEKVEGRRTQTSDKSEIGKGQKRSFDRLLKRRTSKSVIAKALSNKGKTFPDTKIIYLRRSGPGGRTITFPPGMDIPIKTTVTPLEPPVFVKCFVEGCANRKKYACSKTQAPLCSLLCYKVNLEKCEAELILEGSRN